MITLFLSLLVTGLSDYQPKSVVYSKIRYTDFDFNLIVKDSLGVYHVAIIDFSKDRTHVRAFLGRPIFDTYSIRLYFKGRIIQGVTTYVHGPNGIIEIHLREFELEE